MRKFLLIGLLTASSFAQASYIDFDEVLGVSVSAGYTDSKIGSGMNAEISAVGLIFNGSLSFKNLDEEKINGASIGLGLSSVAQVQIGGSNQGAFISYHTL